MFVVAYSVPDSHRLIPFYFSLFLLLLLLLLFVVSFSSCFVLFVAMGLEQRACAVFIDNITVCVCMWVWVGWGGCGNINVGVCVRVFAVFVCAREYSRVPHEDEIIKNFLLTNHRVKIRYKDRKKNKCNCNVLCIVFP